MFHIPISAIKYLCAKYTYFFSHRREKTRRTPLIRGGRDVVEEECLFTSESAQILIGEIMGCNRDLENIKQNINDVQNKMKNIIDVLGRI
ncbi:hypothetical protein AB205_0208770 [Aquarana catesbeiana]|uniref:Uncharacterized protein n=1 Tax=Aquarana catesbeiana TaxID=8400 RepID=A0A2G9RJ35_AQUCT|nr:hypothetical protein AB205_0208770 [Aquarana catesbeiana]